MSKVIVHRHAVKYLQRLPNDTRERIKKILSQLGQSHLEYPGVKHMVGEWAGYKRIRAGQLRIIYWYDEKEDIIYVDHIGSRGDIYK